jgi:hypothetical protein
MTTGKGLEIEPVSEFCLTGLATQDDVFMPDAMTALAIESRFIGSNHSREQRLRICLPSDALWAFMNTEIVADTVACSMSEVSSSLP